MRYSCWEQAPFLGDFVPCMHSLLYLTILSNKVISCMQASVSAANLWSCMITDPPRESDIPNSGYPHVEVYVDNFFFFSYVRL